MSKELHYMAMAGTTASESLAKAADTLAARRQKATNDYFNYAHSGVKYVKDDYTRIAFKSNADVQRFISDMASQGITAVATPFRVQGQYLAELPNKMADGRSSSDVLRDFSTRSYVQYDANPRVDQQQRPRDYQIGGIADEFLMSSEFGQVLHTLSEVNHVLGAGQYGEKSNKEIFKTPLYHDGTANPVVDSGRAKTATVINDNIVMMDGQVVKDEALRNYVLSQHEARIDKASELKYHNAVDYVNRKAEEFDTLYYKKMSGETLSPYQLKELNKAYDVLGGIGKDLGREITKDHPLTARELRDFNEKRLAGSELTESSKALLSSINDIHRNLSVRETNAEYILKHSDRQEYAISKSFKGIDTLKPTTSLISRWDMGALNKITNQLNTSLTAAYELANTKFIYDMDESDFKKLANSLDNSKDAKPAVAQIFENMDKGWADALARQKLNGSSDITKGLYISETERNRIIEIMHKKNLSYGDLLTEKGAKEVASMFDEKSRARIEKALTTVTAEDKAFISKMEKSFSEPKKLLQNNKLLADLKNASWAKGIGVNGSISAMDLATMNKNFLSEAASKGYNFANLRGQFNLKKLQKLNAAEMAKLGLTENTRNMLLQLNAKGAFGSVGIGGTLSSLKKFGKKGITLIRKMDDHGEGWQDISELASFYSNVKQGATAAVSGLHSAKAYAGAKIDNWRLKHPKKPTTGNNVKKVKPRTNTKKELTDAARANAAKKAEKLGVKTEKKIAKTLKKQNSLGARVHRVGQRFAHRIAQTKVARLVNFFTSALNKVKSFVIKKLAIPAALFIMKGVMFTYVVIVVAVLVIALIDMIKGLFDINAMLAPKTYQDTVAYTLYSQLKDEETKFLCEMSEADKKAPSQLNTLTFGYLGQPTKQYVDGKDHTDDRGIDNISNVYYDEGSNKMYINPFWKDNTVDPTNQEDREKYCTEVKEFDGTHQYTISTNLNYYSITSDISHPQEPQYGISNGHTSNIKDIICMTDVMFQMQASESDTAGGKKGDGENSGLGSILGKSPEQLNWNAFTDSVGKCFSIIGEFFCNLWDWLTGQNPTWEYETLKTPMSSVTYDTVWKYARALFILSHQQYIYLDVEYGDINKKLVNGDGTVLEYTNSGKTNTLLEPTTAMYFGINNGVLTEKNFEIKRHNPRDPESIAPVIKDRFLDTGGFDVTITMEDLAEGEMNRVCLWTDMPKYDDTIDLGADFGLQYYATVSGAVWDRITHDLGHCWYHSNYIEHPMIHLHQEYHASGTYSITVGGTKNGPIGPSTSGTPAPNFGEITQNIIDQMKEEYDSHEPWMLKDCYIIQENYAKRYEFTVKDFGPNTSDDHDTVMTSQESYKITDGDGNVIGGYTVTTYAWHIDFVADQDIYSYKETIRLRSCKGDHKFVYDGGHISTHTVGNVFSITDEQLALTGVFDDGDEPIALFSGNTPYADNLTSHHGDYIFETNYDKLKGKVVKSKIDYTSAGNAQSSGGGPTPAEDIYQGTAVSKGLNVAATSSGYWAAESHLVGSELDATSLTTVSSGNYVRLCRDLFDCDCVYLKGALMFPFKKLSGYEGWTADNMLLACNRMCMDWYEVYGFDISQEIGDCDYALSEVDIEMLLVGLRTQYGSKFPEQREKAIKAMLQKVGRGHYCNLIVGQREDGTDAYAHDEHGFLSSMETAVTSLDVRSKITNGDTISYTNSVAFSGSCNAGTSLDLLYYARNYALKAGDDYPPYGAGVTIANKIAKGLDSWNKNLSRIKPADMIYHAPYKSTLPEGETDNNYYLPSDAILRDNELINGKALLDNHLAEQAVVFVGVFDSAAIDAMKEYLKGELKEETYNVVVGNESYAPLNGMRAIDGSGGGSTTKVPAGSIMMSQGSYITAGVPVVIDLSQMGMFSGIYLRSEASWTDDLHEYVGDLHLPYREGCYDEGGTLKGWYYTSPFTGGSYILEAEKTKWALRTTYYWVLHPDERTFFTDLGALWNDFSF